MQNLTKLIHLIQITRKMPQYGHALAGGGAELPSLASHHYLVAFIAWRLALAARSAGADINVEEVLEFALVHDLGELFGGDISMPYAKANPKARKHAKAFEAENHKFLSKFFGDHKERFTNTSGEIMDAESDEALIAKVADYIDNTEYKLFINSFSKKDIDLIRPKLKEKISKIKDNIAQKSLEKFIQQWLDEMGNFETFDGTIKKILGL